MKVKRYLGNVNMLEVWTTLPTSPSTVSWTEIACELLRWYDTLAEAKRDRA